MIIFTVDARFVRAAQLACAGTKDKRNYLHGIHFRTDGIIEATNGHVIYQGQWDKYCALENNLILQIDGKIPGNADTVTFTIDGADSTARTDTGKLFAVKRIDAQFPNVGCKIPITDRPDFSNGLALDPYYLVKIGQMVGGKRYSAALVMTHGTEHETLLFTLGIGGEGASASTDPFINSFKVVLMPMICPHENFLQSYESKAA